MLSFLLDHFKIESARRALLAVSTFTIIIPSTLITGTGVNLFGLTIHYDQDGFLALSRFITSYFLWVFGWLFVVEFSEKLSMTVSKHYKKKAMEAEKEAKDQDRRMEDAEYASESAENFYDIHSRGDYDFEPWWAESFNAQKTSEKINHTGQLIHSVITNTSGAIIGGATPLALGTAAVFFPIQVNKLLFCLFG